MGGHGAGGSEAGPTLPPNGTAADKELKAETFQLGKGDKASDHLSDRYLAASPGRATSRSPSSCK
jgi:hypothetical protein